MVFPRRIRAVVFDMDGLLVDTEALIRDIYVELAVARGVSMPQHVFHRMIGLPTAASDAVARAHFGPDFPLEALHADVNARVRSACEVGVALKAGVVELLDHLDTAQVPRAIATSSGHPAVQRTLGPSGILPRFDAVVAAGDYARGKPNPDPFLTAAQRLGVAPGDCLALEDSHNGVRAAHAAGMMTVMVPDLLEPTDEMREKCLAIAESLHHVREMIERTRGAAAL
jgi:HAD superfamily hydrolase (TIGR01509 family)